jgi:hypothetical protein
MLQAVLNPRYSPITPSMGQQTAFGHATSPILLKEAAGVLSDM